MKAVIIRNKTVNGDMCKFYFTIPKKNVLKINQLTLTDDATIMKGQTPLKSFKGKVLVHRWFTIRVSTIQTALKGLLE